MLTRYLNRLFERRDLSPLEMEEALRIVTGGEVAHSQIGAFLAALRMKGVSRSELVGAARMLRRVAAFIDCGRREVVDVVGTGGDGSNSFNISTASAFAAAGAGVTVAKHGNRAASSRCGSAIFAPSFSTVACFPTGSAGRTVPTSRSAYPRNSKASSR